MKRCYLLICLLLLSCTAMATTDLSTLLNKVILQLHTEQWVTTQTALVNVSVNAAVADQGIEKIQNNVLGKLAQLASKGEWHIIALNREQDKSGLESIQIIAQARLAQTDLNGLRDKAKALSKPGETFVIDEVQFTPSEAEIRAANVAMRAQLYQQAKAEIDELNKIYPDQKYYLYQINFNNVSMAPVPMMQASMSMAKMNREVSDASPIAVGNKVELYATVIIAAMPTQLMQQVGALKGI